MAFTLSDLLQGAYRDLGDAIITKVTGGSTTTAILGNLLNDLTDDDILLNGALFVVRDAGGASAAPEGQFSRITQFDSATGTCTLADTLTSAIASGDMVMVVKAQYPIDTMIELANDALELIGKIPLETTLTTADNTTGYTLGVAYIHMTPSRVQYCPDTTSDVRVDLFDYYMSNTAPGSDPKLFLPQLPAGRTVYLTYYATHPKVTTYSGVIEETIDPKLARTAMRLIALKWNVRRQQGGSQFLTQDLNTAQAEYDQIHAERAPMRVKKPQRFIRY